MPTDRFQTTRRIEFSDTDMGGIVHFSRYVIFMETAEHEFLEALGTSVVTERDGHTVGWPRVSLSASYESPARFGDTLEIEVTVRRKGRTSMTYGFVFRIGERIVARGEMTSVCCVMGSEGLRSVEIPDVVAEKVMEVDSAS